MIIVREVKPEDLDAIYSFSQHAMTGFTSLPPNREFLEKKISRSLRSFNKALSRPGDELYFFILEDTQSKKAIGCSAIEAKVGTKNPFYSLKILHESAVYQPQQIKASHDVLMLTNDFENCSELCSLFLESAYRSKYYGKLLSFSRLMFIAMARHRFADILFAEIRGVSEAGYCPFWEGFGKIFFQMEFAQADFLNALGEPIIEALMPKLPIYCSLLSRETQCVIGKMHIHSQSAFQMLTDQGLEYTNYIDVFDGGPTVSTKIDNIHLISHSHSARIISIKKNITNGEFCLLGTLTPKICFILDYVKFQKPNIITISEEAACLLDKKSGEEIQLYKLGV